MITKDSEYGPWDGVPPRDESKIWHRKECK
jgi:hypothetical protein